MGCISLPTALAGSLFLGCILQELLLQQGSSMGSQVLPEPAPAWAPPSMDPQSLPQNCLPTRSHPSFGASPCSDLGLPPRLQGDLSSRAWSSSSPSSCPALAEMILSYLLTPLCSANHYYWATAFFVLKHMITEGLLHL